MKHNANLAVPILKQFNNASNGKSRDYHANKSQVGTEFCLNMSKLAEVNLDESQAPYDHHGADFTVQQHSSSRVNLFNTTDAAGHEPSHGSNSGSELPSNMSNRVNKIVNSKAEKSQLR